MSVESSSGAKNSIFLVCNIKLLQTNGSFGLKMCFSGKFHGNKAKGARSESFFLIFAVFLYTLFQWDMQRLNRP